jgi:3-dehydroquinate dehydratase-1
MTIPRSIEVGGRPLGSGAIPAICVPLVGHDRDALLSELDTIVPKSPDLIEWRVDFFRGIGTIETVVDAAVMIHAAARGIPILFTRRSAAEGGEPVAIDEAAVLAVYEAVCAAKKIDIIDYELVNPPARFARLREVSRTHGVAMIGSYHNFESTPATGELLERCLEAERRGADIAKIAVMPKTTRDVLTLLSATHDASRSLDIPVIGMSMGAQGSVSRIVGGVFGSALTFAVGKSSSAPGQIPIEDLRVVLATVKRAEGE